MSAAVIRARADEHHTDSEAIDQSGDAAKAATPLTDVNPASAIGGAGMTPLMRASCDGRIDEVRLLLNSGSDVNAKRTDGFTPLALAAFFGNGQVVRLLLESGADVDDKGRCETSAEMWAAVRGFLGISDLIRETRIKSQAQASPSVISKLHEHPRSLQQAKKQDFEEVAPEVAAEPVQPPGEDAEITRESKAIEAGVAVDTNDSVTAAAHVLSVDTVEPGEQIETERRPGVHRMLPEIVDLPPIKAPEFRPGAVFLARITSSWKNLAALTLAVMIICGLATFGVFKIGRALTGDRQEPVNETSKLPEKSTEKSNDAVVPIEHRIPEQPATQTLPPAAADEANTDAPNVEESTANSDNTVVTSKAESDTLRQTAPASIAKNRKSDNVTKPTFANRNLESSSRKHDSVIAPTIFRSSSSSRKRGPVSANAVSKQQAVVDVAPKPAPLSVESTRNRTTSSATERGSERPNSQTPPLGVSSGKPRSKVIQWP